MTREEAFKKAINIVAYYEAHFAKSKEAREDAANIIEALEQEPCDDAISRQAVLDKKKIVELEDGQSFYRISPKDVETLPPVTPQAKMGRWIAYEVRLPDRTILNYRCSVCGRKLIGYDTETSNEAPFCHCGAKMQESEG